MLQILEFIVFYLDEGQDLHASTCNDTTEPALFIVHGDGTKATRQG
jgi:hypothetical protein